VFVVVSSLYSVDWAGGKGGQNMALPLMMELKLIPPPIPPPTLTAKSYNMIFFVVLKKVQ
jgi:hypothetical protein